MEGGTIDESVDLGEDCASGISLSGLRSRGVVSEGWGDSRCRDPSCAWREASSRWEVGVGCGREGGWVGEEGGVGLVSSSSDDGTSHDERKRLMID